MYHDSKSKSSLSNNVSGKKLNDVMNTKVKPTLKLGSTWGAQKSDINRILTADTMKSAINIGMFFFYENLFF